ncbi:MAG: hypothetical protein JW904_07175 [Spirochaetales bacterium]|nr:hypothetical protein [Spirochaetales bacterium]
MGESAYLSLTTILEKSVEFEKMSAQFYKDLQSKTDDHKIIILLELLEKQEIEHQHTLERLLAKKEIPDVHIQFPPEINLVMPKLTKENPAFMDIIDLAIEREIVSASIYEESSRFVTGAIKDLLDGLAKCERIHERSLKELKHQ